MTKIDPRAVVAEGAKIGEGTEIGPYVIIGPDVVIGKNNKIGPFVNIEGKTTIGDGNQIISHVSIGTVPQDLKFKDEDSEVVIEDNNIIREFVAIHKGTKNGRMKTKIGSNNYFMASSHVGHDVFIGNHNLFTNGVLLGGHTTVGNYVNFAGTSGTHPFVRIGDYSFIASATVVIKDILPCCYAFPNEKRMSARLLGINEIGLSRNGFSKEEILRVEELYRKLLLCKEGSFKERRARLLANPKPKFELERIFLEFLSGDSVNGLALHK